MVPYNMATIQRTLNQPQENSRLKEASPTNNGVVAVDVAALTPTQRQGVSVINAVTKETVVPLNCSQWGMRNLTYNIGSSTWTCHNSCSPKWTCNLDSHRRTCQWDQIRHKNHWMGIIISRPHPAPARPISLCSGPTLCFITSVRSLLETESKT